MKIKLDLSIEKLIQFRTTLESNLANSIYTHIKEFMNNTGMQLTEKFTFDLENIDNPEKLTVTNLKIKINLDDFYNIHIYQN